MKTVTVHLNGSQLVFSRANGALLSLTEPEGNRLIDSVPERGGLIDVACPQKKFGPFRLASRYSRGCEFESSSTAITVRYPNLGGSRDDLGWRGKVSAGVTIGAHADGRSLTFDAWVENHSAVHLPQILFPDFCGLVAQPDMERTWFRQGGVKMRPFLELNGGSNFGVNQFWRGTWWEFFEPGLGWWGGTSVGRWSHFGSQEAGLGVFETGWHPAPEHAVMVRVPEDEPRRARMCFTRELTKWQQLDGHLHTKPEEGAAPGKTWRSAHFVVTPHAGSWPHGIATYRQLVREKPCATLTPHVRDDLGFRTVFMYEMQEFNPKRCHFRWKDLPRLARESKAVGIRELNVWNGLEAFKLPLQLQPLLGSKAEFAQAMRACRDLGVNVSLMMSVYTLEPRTGRRFGTGGKSDSGWSYHTEAVPAINPGYYTSYAGHGVNPSNRKWQAEVLRGVRRLLKLAPFSICWDQYIAGMADRSIDDLARAIAETSRRNNPLATFSGESTGSIEAESQVLHYTWNWRSDVMLFYRTAHRMPDYGAPAMSLWRAPRLNFNVEDDLVRVLRGFADGFYLNFLIRRKNGIWGSGEFRDFPALRKTLAQLARLRRRYLKFFTEGEALGEGLIREEIAGIHTSGYRHKNRLLLFVVDERPTGRPQKVTVTIDVARWISTAGAKLRCEEFSLAGKVRARTIPRRPSVRLTLSGMRPGELRGLLL